MITWPLNCFSRQNLPHHASETRVRFRSAEQVQQGLHVCRVRPLLPDRSVDLEGREQQGRAHPRADQHRTVPGSP